MTIDERSRHRLYLRLEEVLGQEEATVLMEHLPPVGWAEVATKRDLDTLRAEIELKLEAVEGRMDARLERRLTELPDRLTARMIAVNSATVVLLGGLMAALKLF